MSPLLMKRAYKERKRAVDLRVATTMLKCRMLHIAVLMHGSDFAMAHACPSLAMCASLRISGYMSQMRARQPDVVSDNVTVHWLSWRSGTQGPQELFLSDCLHRSYSVAENSDSHRRLVLGAAHILDT